MGLVPLPHVSTCIGGRRENGRKRGRGFDRLLCEMMACAVGDDGIAGWTGGWLATQCGASRCASADLPNAALCPLLPLLAAGVCGVTAIVKRPHHPVL